MSGSLHERPRSRVEALAAFFKSQPFVFVDGRELGSIAGAYAWRSRVSDLRRPPFSMSIVNRQRRGVRADGTSYVTSAYAYVPEKNEDAEDCGVGDAARCQDGIAPRLF